MADRILVADDEPPIREVVSSMLSAANYTCQECSSGADALQMLKSQGPFQLVLYDLTMKDLDGITFLDHSKQAYPEMPLVVVASISDISIALAAIRDGAYDYLLKPFEREQLLKTVSRALENHRLRVENRTYQTNLESLVRARTDQLQTSMRNLERSYDITLDALSDAMGVKDQDTVGHARRVTAFSIAIAKAMRLPQEKIPTIARAAFLHDIGKIAIPDAILRKPGNLTLEETATMQQHCDKGFQIVKKIPFLVDACDIIYSHHERYDGTGYPRGLRSQDIPLGARIVAVANALDSITSDLPYRPAQSFTTARNEIKLWSGRQFDPEIVQVFLDMPQKLWEDLRRDVGKKPE
jgi:putative nucleotidyltransferase with HDIG domain